VKNRTSLAFSVGNGRVFYRMGRIFKPSWAQLGAVDVPKQRFQVSHVSTDPTRSLLTVQGERGSARLAGSVSFCLSC